jgi:ubiquinone/menaquinone biosynthesis C-methylase UbiE
MFRNWIDLSEFPYFLRKVRRDSDLLRRLTSKISRSKNSRVKASWAIVERPGNWWDIPAVQARWNKMMTGDESKTHYEYISEKHLSGKSGLQALSLGCGTGAKEIRWAKTGKFARIDAYDLATEAIKEAQESIRGTEYANIVRFGVGNAQEIGFSKGEYDLVIFDHSLHHFSPLESLLVRLRDVLKPQGLLIANEFIGPTRFQWTDRQLEIVNGLLSLFPPQYMSLWNSPLSRLPARRPSKLSMWLSDPSESIESSNIAPLLHKHFTVLEQNGYGGAILHLLFTGIAHHFYSPDDNGKRLLRLCFDAEDFFLDNGEVEHDFALLICRK